MENIEHLLNTYSLYLLAFGTASLAILALIALRVKKLTEESKKILFLAIILVTLIPTIVMSASTVYLNTISSSGGPVHWHADLEIWDCGTKIDLLNPQGLSNRVGTPVFHEHNDFRIHVEGAVVKKKDISLGNFFNVVGGVLTGGSLEIPTNGGITSLQEGDLCNGKPGKVQVFVYKVVNPKERGNWIYTQEKIENFADYVLSSYSMAPPGDCIIIEFDSEKEKTDKICTTYEAAVNRGELHGR